MCILLETLDQGWATAGTRAELGTRAAESQEGPQGRTSLWAPCQNIVNYGHSHTKSTYKKF